LFLRLSELHINSQSLWRQESEPLESYGRKSSCCEGVLPMRETQMHNHQAEVVCKGVCYEIPVAAQILEPDLRRL